MHGILWRVWQSSDSRARWEIAIQPLSNGSSVRSTQADISTDYANATILETTALPSKDFTGKAVGLELSFHRVGKRSGECTGSQPMTRPYPSRFVQHPSVCDMIRGQPSYYPQEYSQ